MIHLLVMLGLVSASASQESADSTVTDASEAFMELPPIASHAESVSTAGTELLESLSTRPRLFLLLSIISETMALQERIKKIFQRCFFLNIETNILKQNFNP